MDIKFKDKKLLRQMSSERELSKAFGDRAKRIKMRLGVLMEADSLDDVPADPPTRRHELTGDYAGCFGIDVTGNWRLVIAPGHDPVPTKLDGGADLEKITSIVIMGVIDYH